MRPASPLMVLALALAALLAGCAEADEEPETPEPVPTVPREETLRDDLTARLHPASGPFFPDLWIEDVLELPGGGNMSLNTGLGVRCEGNATSVAPAGSVGWVTCSLRLAADPTALVESSRRLEIGFDYQPLTQRTPAEPVEWRVVVEAKAVNATTDATESRTAFDSGWRPVDLSARVSPLAVSTTVEDPCDTVDNAESPPLSHRGQVLLNASFTVLSHAQVTIRIDLGDSVFEAPPSGWPPAEVAITPHALNATFPAWGSEQPMALLVMVDLETDALPGSATPGSGPCPGAYAHEAQTWTVTLDYVGADGRGGQEVVEVPFDVYLAP